LILTPSALITGEYLDKLAERGKRKKFERAMARIPKVKPEEHDRLPA
jgi:hypothetical protein